MAKFLSQDQINAEFCFPKPRNAELSYTEPGQHLARGLVAEFLAERPERSPGPLQELQGAYYKECFSLYDKQQRGKIKATDLLVSMRCLGASPTPGEVQRHLQTHGIDKHGELDFSTFLTIMHMQIKQEDPKKEILLAMLMADKEKKGYIMASELRSKLMKLGEKLTHKEVDDLFKEAGIEPNGQVKYDAFIQRITLPVRDY
ncbi:Calmodulin-like protein 4 [Apodemus speciosus]|uniref:Calmodulin-like protein 4 n=1 Tax=Apodemus speciosus TaxID=105296 RepID=A0ABQ0F4X0_APOSI